MDMFLVEGRLFISVSSHSGNSLLSQIIYLQMKLFRCLNDLMACSKHI